MASFHISVKSGKPGSAANHAAYIAREGKHGKNGGHYDLVTKEHGNLPEWTDGDPLKFWKTADVSERINGAVYREFEVALPMELPIRENIDLVHEFIAMEIGDKPFQFAIHMPMAALGKVEQPHAHIMFSDRKPDGIERAAEQHFKRYNPYKPELGGCKKDSGGKEKGVLKAEIVKTREVWAELQNKYLIKNGYDARVDHRSNRDRGIKHEPEQHLGHVAIAKMSQDERDTYHHRRQSPEHV